MQRAIVLVYGVICYLLFFGTFLYSIGFIGDFGVPKTIDSGSSGPLVTAVVVNLGLLGLFGLQHSGMARPGFKRWLTRFIPEPAERSTYVLLTNVVLWATYYFWQPMTGTVWHVETEAARIALQGLYFVGWAILFYATILISHFDLFGLRQVFLFARGRAYEHLPFDTPSLYGYVRHPLYIGWFTIVWATPTMTLGHLLFAAVCTAYILVAIQLEERDLVDHFGEDYERYRDEVPMLIPNRRRGRPVGTRAAQA